MAVEQVVEHHGLDGVLGGERVFEGVAVGLFLIALRAHGSVALAVGVDAGDEEEVRGIGCPDGSVGFGLERGDGVGGGHAAGGVVPGCEPDLGGAALGAGVEDGLAVG